MAPGLFLFAKAPRAFSGLGSFGGEVWLDRRRRDFFDQDGGVAGHADSEAWTAKLQALYPLKYLVDGATHWQVGVRTEFVSEKPAKYVNRDGRSASSEVPGGVTMPDDTRTSLVLTPIVLFDDLAIDQMTTDGLRAFARSGIFTTQGTSHAISELEGYGYLALPYGLNLAAHGFYGRGGSDTLRSLYFMGGFDSVRGLPDGIHFGRNMYYGNFETRVLTAKWPRLHVQPGFFVDHGSTYSTTEELLNHRETTVGVRLRMAVPQIYRLLLRIDYGWGIGQTKTHGLSVGLNQFFQPYKMTF